MAERAPFRDETNHQLPPLPTRRGRYPSFVSKNILSTPEEIAQQESKEKERIRDIEGMFIQMGTAAVMMAVHPLALPVIVKFINGLLQEPMSEALSDPTQQELDPAGILIKGTAGFVADGVQSGMG